MAQANEPSAEGRVSSSTRVMSRRVWRRSSRCTRRGGPDGRFAQAGRFRRNGADSVPRERRCEPRADGLQHAAAGSAADRARSAPLIGTGMEYKAAQDSGALWCWPGRTAWLRAFPLKDSRARRRNAYDREYKLIKFSRSNQGTCINQFPIVKNGDALKKGDRSSRTARPPTLGELALGRNVLVGFMTWEGYNYEDAILISERLVQDDVFTSIHIEGYESEARDTKLGPEEITRDIPNVGEDALKGPRRARHHPHRRGGARRRHPRGQGDAQGRDGADRGRAAAARDIRREGAEKCGILRCACRMAKKASSWTSRCSRARTRMN